MKALKIALCLPLAGLVPLSAKAEPSANADPRDYVASASHPKKSHYKVAHPRYLPPPPVEPFPPVAAVPVFVPRPYDWSGVYVGGYAGVTNDDHGPQLTVPTYGALQGNDVGFAGSNFNNSYNVDSQPYNALANGTNSNAAAAGALNGPFATGYTTYTATGSAYGYSTNGNNTSVANNAASTSYNGTVANTGSFATVTPYNNLNGDRTDSQLTTNSSTRRLLGMLGGEVGYRKQFGQFVLGVEADGGYIDGRNTQTSNTTGQFSNSQGANTTATATECTSGNGAGGCGSALTNSSNGSVNVANNGNSSFSQQIQAGPQWLGTARLSAGVAMDRVLLYATGGFAYGEADLAVASSYRDTANSVCSGNAGSPTNGSIAGATSVAYSCNGAVNTGSSYTYSDAAQWSGSSSRLLTGFAVGSGMAYAMTDNIILKLEGYYYNLGSISTTAYGVGSQTLTVNSGNAPAGSTPGTRVATVTPYNVSRNIDGFIAKVGVQFKFNTWAPEPVPVVAKY